MKLNPTQLIGLSIAAGLAIAACGSDEPASDGVSEVTTTSSADAAEPATADSTATAAEVDATQVGLDPTAFFDGALVGDVATTDCTTVGGTDTSCYELTVAGFPSTRDAFGPWCPSTTSDNADDVGIWFDGNAVYDLDGEFIVDLAEIYDDDTWRLYDEDGNVLSTDTSEKFNDLVTGGAQADADAGPVNLCVYGEIE